VFAWMGTRFDAILSTYALGVVSALMSALTPVVLTTMTLWVALYGWAVLRNEVPETVPTFLWKVFKIGLVLTFALQSGFYIANVADTANSLAMGVATTFLPAAADPATISSPYALLDRFNDDASAQVADIMKDASMFRLDLVLAAAIFSIGSVIFLCIALFVVTLSKLLLTFLIAIGPLFIFGLAWRPTARFFDSWLSMLLNAVVLTWFAFFALGLSAYMGQQMFLAIQSGGGFLGATFNVLGEAIRYCVLMILMAIICFQAPSLASALTGVIRAGAGLPQTVGTAATAVGSRLAPAVATGTAAMARQGYGYVRTAAYKLAALRGRA
jgi:type IV secretion system protein VirB6